MVKLYTRVQGTHLGDHGIYTPSICLIPKIQYILKRTGQVLKLNHLKRKMEEVLKDLYRVKVMVFNATFNNFSVIFQRPF
jgi:hypothetical protein